MPSLPPLLEMRSSRLLTNGLPMSRLRFGAFLLPSIPLLLVKIMHLLKLLNKTVVCRFASLPCRHTLQGQLLLLPTLVNDLSSPLLATTIATSSLLVTELQCKRLAPRLSAELPSSTGNLLPSSCLSSVAATNSSWATEVFLLSSSLLILAAPFFFPLKKMMTLSLSLDPLTRLLLVWRRPWIWPWACRCPTWILL